MLLAGALSPVEQGVVAFAVDLFLEELAAGAALQVVVLFVVTHVVVATDEVDAVDAVVREAEEGRQNQLTIWMLKWMSIWAATLNNQNTKSSTPKWILIGMATAGTLDSAFTVDTFDLSASVLWWKLLLDFKAVLHERVEF